jgi:phosphoglucosamine mutase
MEEMRSRGANLGGEDSGHIIFLDHHTTGDGLISALQVIRAIKTFKKPLSELSALMTVFPQTVVNVQVKRKPALSTVPDLVKAIEKVEKELGEKGRVLVRYSGTEPVCRIMVEGEKKKEIEDHARQIGDVVRMQLDEEGSGRKA